MATSVMKNTKDMVGKEKTFDDIPNLYFMDSNSSSSKEHEEIEPYYEK